MRVVLDTSILISAAIIRSSVPGRVIDTLMLLRFESITSAPILRELNGVLRRPQIVVRHQWSENEIEEFVRVFTEVSEVVDPLEEIAVVRDASDNRLLEAAVEGNAQFLITGDSDLLDLKTFRGTQMVRASEFLLILELDDLQS